MPTSCARLARCNNKRWTVDQAMKRLGLEIATTILHDPAQKSKPLCRCHRDCCKVKEGASPEAAARECGRSLRVGMLAPPLG